MDKQIKQFLKRIERHGWRWEKRKGGHLRLKGPEGQIVYCGSTPSDHRAYKNIERDMRRASGRSPESR